MKKFKDLSGPNDGRMALTTKNYVLLLIGLCIIVLGFVLMAGGGSDYPTGSTTPCSPGAASRWPRFW